VEAVDFFYFSGEKMKQPFPSAKHAGAAGVEFGAHIEDGR